MSKKGRYYLAGPMTGIPQFNYPMFDAAASILRSAGWTIVSPAELDDPAVQAAARASKDGAQVDGGIDGQTWGDFLARDVKLVADECDGVIVLPGWQRSRGARLEVTVAMLTGKPVLLYENGAPEPRPNVAADLARASGVTPVDLI